MLSSQCNAFHICGDAGVNKPTMLPVTCNYIHIVIYNTQYLIMVKNNMVYIFIIPYLLFLEHTFYLQKKVSCKTVFCVTLVANLTHVVFTAS